MPNFDKTGPAGVGAKTGGQMGKCADAKPQSRPFDGRGKGMGQGLVSRGSTRGLRGRLGKGRSNNT